MAATYTLHNIKWIVTQLEESRANPLASSGLGIINSDLTEVQLIHKHICARSVNVMLSCFTWQGLFSLLPASNGKMYQRKFSDHRITILSSQFASKACLWTVGGRGICKLHTEKDHSLQGLEPRTIWLWGNNVNGCCPCVRCCAQIVLSCLDPQNSNSPRKDLWSGPEKAVYPRKEFLIFSLLLQIKSQTYTSTFTHICKYIYIMHRYTLNTQTPSICHCGGVSSCTQRGPDPWPQSGAEITLTQQTGSSTAGFRAL